MIYADTSFLIELRVPLGAHHRAALAWHEDHQPSVWLWSPWHRAELFNTIRQLARTGTTTRRESSEIIRRFEADVRAEYFVHTEPDWRDVMRKFSELSVAHDDLTVRAADLLHVAYAIESSGETFVTLDSDQRKLAAAAGLDAPAIL